MYEIRASYYSVFKMSEHQSTSQAENPASITVTVSSDETDAQTQVMFVMDFFFSFFFFFFYKLNNPV